MIKTNALLGYLVRIRSKICQGWKFVKQVKILKVLRMGLPIVDNLSGLQESIFSLFRSSQQNSHKKSKNLSIFMRVFPLPLFPHVGPMAVWGLGLLLFWMCSTWNLGAIKGLRIDFSPKRSDIGFWRILMDGVNAARLLSCWLPDSPPPAGDIEVHPRCFPGTFMGRVKTFL